MKQKTHSGIKKRVKIRKSGRLMLQKSAKKHLLADKSKRQKRSFPHGMPIDFTRIRALRRLLPGKVNLKRNLKGAAASTKKARIAKKASKKVSEKTTK